MFGEQARLQTMLQQSNPSPVDHEEQLLQQLQQKLGPHTDGALLLHHLRMNRGKISWAVNSYLRAVMSIPPSAGREDFDTQPTRHWVARMLPCAADMAPAMAGAAAAAAPPLPQPNTTSGGGSAAAAATSAAAVRRVDVVGASSGVDSSTGPSSNGSCISGSGSSSEEAVGASCLTGLSLPLLELVLLHFDHCGLACLAVTCKLLQQACASDAVWQAAFQHRWGTCHFPTSSNGASGAARGQQQPPQQQVPVFGHHHHQRQRWRAPMHSRGGCPSAAGSRTQEGALAGSTGPAAMEHQSAAASTAAAAAAEGGGGGGGGDGMAAAAAAGCGTAAAAAAPEELLQAGTITIPSAPPLPPPALVPAAAAAAGRSSWRARYRQQLGYEQQRLCPKCGGARLLPLLYGFPSPPLLAGVAGGRLVLAGDHLMEECHVWVCHTGCHGCFRYYPYRDVQLWQQDEDRESRRQLRLNRQAGSSSSGGGGGGQPQGPGGGGGAAAAGGAAGVGQGGLAEGVVRYTYES